MSEHEHEHETVVPEEESPFIEGGIPEETPPPKRNPEQECPNCGMVSRASDSPCPECGEILPAVPED